MNNLLLCSVAFLQFAGPASIGIADDPAAAISGSVKLNGAPLTEGKLLVKRPGDEKPIETPIKAGLYSAEKIAAGDYVVAIEGKGVPARYSSFDVSPLKVSIKAGANTLDFALVGD
jgi:hypothetical protein